MMAKAKKATKNNLHVKRGVSDDDVEVGRRIRLIRLQRNISQQSLGAVLNVSFQQVQKYEKGTNRISSGRLMDIAKALDTTPHELMGWNDKGEIAAIDPETYKLAKAFLVLRDELKRPVRLLINTLVEEGA
jgi:transcriptional regulator with XRE-family HTH domain